MSDKTDLILEYDRIGDKGKVNLTVRLGGEVLAIDNLNVLSSTAR